MTGNSKNSKYGIADIEKYLDGELSAAEMHELEKASLEDPFLGDALDGMETDRLERGIPAFGNDLIDLKKRLEERINPPGAQAPPSPRMYWWRIAAAIILLAGTGLISYYSIVDKQLRKQSLAENKQKDSVLPDHTGAANSMNNPGSRATDTVKTALVKTEEIMTRANEVENKWATDNKTTHKKPANQTTSPNRTANTIESAAPVEQAFINPDQKVKDTIGLITANQPNPSLPAPALANQISGKVVGINNLPVANAYVSLKNQTLNVLTDSTGVFTLRIARPDSLVKITVQSKGYQMLTTSLQNEDYYKDVNADKIFAPENALTYNKNVIRLQPSAESAGETVAGNFSSGKKARSNALSPSNKTGVHADVSPDLKNGGPSTLKKEALPGLPEPGIGWTEFNRWLEKNKKITTADSVLRGHEVISFRVSKSGAASSFRIEKSLSPAHDAEVIRLIRQGPAWKSTRGNKERVTISIPF